MSKSNFLLSDNTSILKEEFPYMLRVDGKFINDAYMNEFLSKIHEWLETVTDFGESAHLHDGENSAILLSNKEHVELIILRWSDEECQ